MVNALRHIEKCQGEHVGEACVEFTIAPQLFDQIKENHDQKEHHEYSQKRRKEPAREIAVQDHDATCARGLRLNR